MSQELFAHMFKGLVDQLKGVDAAAAAIASSVGHPVSIGTISRIGNGNAEVPLAWAYALQDATGNYCFDAYRNSVTARRVGEAAIANHLDALRESTEMVQALAHAESSPSREAIIRARKEVADVHTQTGEIIAAYDQMLSGAAE